MSDKIKLEDLKSNYIKKHELDFIRNYLPEEENKIMTLKYEKSTMEEGRIILKEYGYDYDSSLDKYTFFKKEPCEVDENVLNQFILLQLNEKIDKANSNISLIKDILIFFLIVKCTPYIMSFISRLGR